MTVISSASLSVTDVEIPATNLLFKVSNVSRGQFELTSDSGMVLSEFLQLLVMANNIRFVNNGNDDSPTFPN